MNTFMHKFLLHVILLGTLLCCSEYERVDNVTISIEAPLDKLSNVELTVVDMLNLGQTPIAQATLDSAGTCLLTFPMAKSSLATLKIGDKETTVYLERGYDLNLLIPADSGKIKIFRCWGRT